MSNITIDRETFLKLLPYKEVQYEQLYYDKLFNVYFMESILQIDGEYYKFRYKQRDTINQSWNDIIGDEFDGVEVILEEYVATRWVEVSLKDWSI